MSALSDLTREVAALLRETEHAAAQLTRLERDIGQAAATGSRGRAGGASDAGAAAIRSLRQARASYAAAGRAGESWLGAHGASGRGGGAGAFGADAAGASKDQAPPAMESVWASDPARYTPPSSADLAAMPSLTRQGDPTRFAPHVNDGGTGVAGRQANCADCSRAVERCWDGKPAVSAALRDTPAASRDTGEDPAILERWSGQQFSTESLTEVGARLQRMGPGSSAVVGVNWTTGGGHAFNAVNRNGRVMFVDGQTGRTGPWPPRDATAGFGESIMRGTGAVYFR